MSNGKLGYVVSDFSILAIVQGLQRYGLLPETYDEIVTVDGKEIVRSVQMELREAIRETAIALRVVNEYQVAEHSLYKNADGHWVEPYIPHYNVDMRHRRNRSDAEIVAACNCWLSQVETGRPMEFDFLTLVCTVKQLKQKILTANAESGEWERKCWFGTWHYICDGTDMTRFELDLAA